jgi:hypothetical protein
MRLKSSSAWHQHSQRLGLPHCGTPLTCHLTLTSLATTGQHPLDAYFLQCIRMAREGKAGGGEGGWGGGASEGGTSRLPHEGVVEYESQLEAIDFVLAHHYDEYAVFRYVRVSAENPYEWCVQHPQDPGSSCRQLH